MQEKVKGSCVLFRTEEKQAKDKYHGAGREGGRVCVCNKREKRGKTSCRFLYLLRRVETPFTLFSFGLTQSLSLFVQLFVFSSFHSFRFSDSCSDPAPLNLSISLVFPSGVLSEMLKEHIF